MPENSIIDSSHPMKIFVESHTILKNRSGVGWFTYGMVKGLREIARKKDQIELITHPKEQLDIDDLVDNTQIFNRSIDWLPPQLYHAFKFRNIMPPLDLFFGKGIYIFPNFIRWPLLRSPSVIVVHDLSMFVCPQYLHPKNLAFMTKHLPASVKKSDMIVAVSHASKQTLCEHFDIDPNKVIVSHLAAEPSLYYPRKKDEISEVKAKYGIFGDYMLFVSTLEPRKNVEGLIKAYRALPDRLRKETSLVLVGGRGWQDEGIREAIRQARLAGDKIILPGYVETADLPVFYSGAKAFVFPSHYEGFGLGVLEAMSCGAPVITANNSSLVEAGGEAALYIDADNTRQITDAMKRILTDEALRQTLIKKGYKQAAKFSWEKCAQAIMDGIKKLKLDKR